MTAELLTAIPRVNIICLSGHLYIQKIILLSRYIALQQAQIPNVKPPEYDQLLA
jgi:hypothetical protein